MNRNPITLFLTLVTIFSGLYTALIVADPTPLSEPVEEPVAGIVECEQVADWNLPAQFTYNATGNRSTSIPLTLDASRAPALDWAIVEQKVKSLFNVDIQRANGGLPVMHAGPAPESNGTVRWGTVARDQMHAIDTNGNLVRWGGTHYEVHLFQGADEAVLVHEIGHVLGLNHIEAPGHIMADMKEELAYELHDCHAEPLRRLESSGHT